MLFAGRNAICPTVAQIAVALAVVGCADDARIPMVSGAQLEGPTHDSGADVDCSVSDAGSPAARACGELDLEQCASAAHCWVRYGVRVDEQRKCFAESAPVGCARQTNGCDQALGYVRDKRGTIWMFGDLCLPEGLEPLYEDEDHPWGGWNSCDPKPPRPSETRCSELSTTLCASEPACYTIVGLQYDPARRCRSPHLVSIGCMQADQGCTAAVSYARYPGDAIAFELSSGCKPPKYESVNGPGESVSGWPVCPEAAR